MQATDTRVYKIDLTEPEMQMIVYAVSGFYRRVNTEGMKISPTQTAAVLNAMQKFKKAVDPNQADLWLPEDLQGSTHDGSKSSIVLPTP